ncbi:dipeptide ABC transporter ATP-binding protein [Frigidibacter albus]|uniref:Dipeptide ABC transporter ATP-binding protein n=1 Tax=Frigidibacter albus TaxID=1465486 RepID=A0A6L8VE23_9RHOB|nr:ABC transporter ATP-binding protein [Frigidibacter albus]MZQ87579.1 dipeptide ABC transporter ATP-binding protein [Frigidibacter albus]NBE29485.1 dipeptide ABC transporter ATP-binding protein [Frigidibacter albus]GGH44592.1 ABC transporter ATP-binding protein [Frigidibacter albus]
MTEPLIDIRHLSVPLPRGADRAFAVEDLSLTLNRGEILCVVGETGSGKSLTALSLMGLLPTNLPRPQGEILFEGRDLLGLSRRDRLQLSGRRLAMVFQEPIAALNPIYRVGAQVSEVFRLHTDLKRDEIRDKVIDLFREVRLPDPEAILRAYPHQLSGGQCQRVMIATALALDPALLIADEPTTALDVTTQAQILKLMLDLRSKHGTGILFITHDFGVVAEIADRVAVMRHGKLVEIGTRDAVLNDPQADYTRQLIAAVPRLAPKTTAAVLGAPVLSAEGLTKTYKTRTMLGTGREVQALKGVDVTLRRGETLGLVGESGSGKSTLAQCVIRLVEPDGGEVVIDNGAFTGLTGSALRHARRKVQIVFQDPYTALDPRHAVGDAIAEGPIIHGLPREQAKARALELIEAVGLERSAARRFPHEFSGGQRQRICIARALAVRPDLLIADESVSALDVSVQAQILELLARMQKDLQFGLLFITHDLRVASRICDRIAVMQRGEIVEQGPAADLFAHPRNAYTRELLSAVPGRDWQDRPSQGPQP